MAATPMSRATRLDNWVTSPSRPVIHLLAAMAHEASARTTATIRNIAADNAVGPTLRGQADAMQRIQSSFEPLTLFPV